MKKHIPAILYAFLLAAFTVYVLLDTFVIAQVISVVPDGGNSSTTASSQLQETDEPVRDESTGSQIVLTPSEEKTPVFTDNSYSDGNISITITEYRTNDTTVYVADVILSSAEYLKTAFAKDSYGRNVTETTSAIAERKNAILAINGDYYGAQEKGFVLRNGVLYRSQADKDQEDLVIYKDGSFEIIEEKNSSAEAILDKGAEQILSFGPALVVNGQITVDKDDEVGKAMASNPRTAIGIIDELHYLLVVSDGRTNQSEGLSLYELAEFMQSLGVDIAYNLDGGGSSTMVFNGEVINNPTTNGKSIKERSVSDIVYIGY